jgi:hypothetical protein
MPTIVDLKTAFERPAATGTNGSVAKIQFYSDPGYTVLISDIDYRDTVYIEVVTTGPFVPVTYTLTVNNQANTEIQIQKNGTGLFVYQSLFAGLVSFRGEAEDLGLETIGERKDINVDDLSDDTVAAEFIYQHNVLTTATMAATQRAAITGFVKRLKGNGTFNSSDLLTRFQTMRGRIVPYCPIDDTTANAAAYSMDIIAPLDPLIFVNFVAGDITPQGVIGGTSKYLRSSRAMSDWLNTSVAIHAYSRTNFANSRLAFGNGSTLQFYPREGTVSYIALNSGLSGGITNPSTTGLLSASTIVGGLNQVRRAGTLVGSASFGPNTTSNTTEITFHSSSTSLYDNNRQYAGFAAGPPPLTSNEWADWNEAWTWYQTNVITGGRQV